MLLRWLLLRLCRSPRELRLMARYRDRINALDADALVPPVRDRRIARSMRLAVLWALLKIQHEHPRRLGALLAALVGLSIVFTLKWTGWVR